MTTPPPQRRGLGRGLGSLIPTAPREESPAGTPVDAPVEAETVDAAAPGSTPPASGPSASGPPASGPSASPVAADGAGSVDSGAYFAELPVTAIRPNPRQPRTVFDEEAMAELVHSIGEVGLLQPVVVRPVEDGGFELIMGERRWRATQEAGLEAIPAIVRETGDTDMLRDALLENLHRSQLNPLEEAAAYGQLLEDFGCTHDELAQRIGRSRPQISNTLRLLRLSPAVQRRVAAGVLSAGHARALLAVDDGEIQDRLAQRVVAEGISVRGLEEIVSLGDTGRSARQPRTRASAPGLTEIADRLSDRLETRVRVEMGKTRGKISVDFATLDDLQRIIEILDPRNRNDRPI
jgi:ParB family transcriptional regulator, chromosome partitioning protein